MTALSWQPLNWPSTRPRSESKPSQFGDHSIDALTRNLAFHLRMMFVESAIVTSEIPLSVRTGQPLKQWRRGDDPAVAIYWTDSSGTQRCLPIDTWDTVYDNLHAAAKTIEAIRGIGRWSGDGLMNQAMSGVAALPARCEYFSGCTSPAEVKAEYTRLARLHHPDTGGDPSIMASINLARDQALEQFYG